MISTIEVVVDGNDPDGIKAQALHVIEVVLNILPGTTIVVADPSQSSVVT